MYRIIGADGRPYGPVNAEQVRRWIAEGRANAHTQTLVEGAAEWKPLSAVPEFAGHFGAPVPPPISAVSASHARRTNGFALWGMIFGILSCFCCCLNIPMGTLGLVFSLIGLTQINERPDLHEGHGLAIAGIVLSAVGLLIGVLFLLSGLINGNIHTYHHFQFQRF